MDSKPTLDDYDEMTPDYYIDTTPEEHLYNWGHPEVVLVEAYSDEIIDAWRNFGKYANKDE